jgi:hypothetical protein
MAVHDLLGLRNQEVEEEVDTCLAIVGAVVAEDAHVADHVALSAAVVADGLYTLAYLANLAAEAVQIYPQHAFEDFVDHMTVILPKTADLQDMMGDCFVATVHLIHMDFVASVIAALDQALKASADLFAVAHLVARHPIHHRQHSRHVLL